jgi:hypothetical protein
MAVKDLFENDNLALMVRVNAVLAFPVVRKPESVVEFMRLLFCLMEALPATERSRAMCMLCTAIAATSECMIMNNYLVEPPLNECMLAAYSAVEVGSTAHSNLDATL